MERPDRQKLERKDNQTETDSAIQEDNFIPISALQHFLFCPRQCGLIHIEQIWEENRLTVEGEYLHKKVHKAGLENRRDIRRAYGVPISSRRFGLTGKADLIEFHLDESGARRPYPVEFKHGRCKANDCDRIQLCAQVVCLEEMLNIEIPEGALFYGQTRKREIVVIDSMLRNTFEKKVMELRFLLTNRRTPPALYETKCMSCSLIEHCLPRLPQKRNAVKSYLDLELENE